MARPKAFDSKTAVTHVRLTAEEARAFEAAVRQVGQVRARVLRRAVREIITRSPDLFDDGLEEFSRLRFELRAIGRNLNQITRAINSGEEEDLQHIEAVTQAVSEQVGRIDERVSHLLMSTRRRWVRVLESSAGV